jgi:hypothetical protein
VVKTPPFHGGNTGSNPVRVTKKRGCFSKERHPRFFMFLGIYLFAEKAPASKQRIGG